MPMSGCLGDLARLAGGRQLLRIRVQICCAMCREVAEKNAAEFTADKTRNLIVRLQFNVIRAGLRRVNLAYSRISLADVAAKLGATSGHTSIHLAKPAALALRVSSSLPPCCRMSFDVRGARSTHLTWDSQQRTCSAVQA